MDRPLVPAPSSDFRTLPSLSLPPRRRNVATACFACKERKSKCDKQTPCDSCKKNDTDCVTDPGSDLRRETALKRKLCELERDRDVLNELLETLVNGESEQIVSVLGAIRSRASLEEIRRCVESGESVEPGQAASKEVCRVLERLNRFSESTDSEQ